MKKKHGDGDNNDDFGGLERDLRLVRELTDRRRVLHLLAGASLVPIFGCGGGSESPSSSTSSSSSSSSSGSTSSGGTSTSSGGTSSGGTSGTPGGTCAKIPEETAGPF